MNPPQARKPLAPRARKLAHMVGTVAAVAAVAVSCATSPGGAGALGVPAPGAQAMPPAVSAAPPPVVAATPSVLAGPSGGEAGAISTFVSNAQRGQVAPPELADVERMCALLTSCDKLPIPASLVPDDFATCVKKLSDEMTSATAINFSLTLRECGLQSDSCASLRACALRGADGESCSGRGKQGFVGFCDDAGRALTCWHDQTLAVRDCPRGGEQCIVVGGQSTCTLGPCGAIAEGDKPRCSASGTHLLHCEKGKLASLNCAAFGLKCAVAGDGTAGCATGGPSCGPGSTRCDGKVAVGCFNGHEVRVDCAAAGLTCDQGSGGGLAVGACVSPPPTGGSSCDPNEKPKCGDASIDYCAAGRPRSFSCKSLGFGRCDSSRDGLRCAL
jgi:hypothetical protein